MAKLLCKGAETIQLIDLGRNRLFLYSGIVWVMIDQEFRMSVNGGSRTLVKQLSDEEGFWVDKEVMYMDSYVDVRPFPLT